MMHVTIVLICFLSIILKNQNVSAFTLRKIPTQSSKMFLSPASFKLKLQPIRMSLSSFSPNSNQINEINEMTVSTTSNKATEGTERRTFLGTFLENILSKSPAIFRKLRSFLIPLSVLSVIILISFVNPAAAKTAAKSARKNISKVTKAAAVSTKSAVKPPLWKKILEGVNTAGAFKARKAGDTRTEFSAILNSISSILILGVVFFGAFLRHLQRENFQTSAMRKELKKVDEYKENMYFEAVQDILTKISDAKTKGSAKASLQKQLKDLDPEGSIQRFLDGGDRPDISHIINRKQPPKGKKGQAGGVKKRKPEVKGVKKVTSDYGDDDDDEEITRGANKIVPKSPKQPQAKEETYLMMLGELYDGLDGIISDDERANVVEYLKQRIEGISDSTKRDATIRKIAERLGDDDYWVDYAAKLA